MKYVHFSRNPLDQEKLFNPEQEPEPSVFSKPSGLWFSDETTEQSWLQWCKSEEFNLERLKFANHLDIDFSNILILKNSIEILHFTDEFGVKLRYGTYMQTLINWKHLAHIYKGILITPYDWDLRLDQRTRWYYTWDCASGCIWDKSAIKAIRTEKFDLSVMA